MDRLREMEAGKPALILLKEHLNIENIAVVINFLSKS
jgi:hypothetical protein